MSMRPIRLVLAALLAASVTAGCNKEKSPAASATANTGAGAQCDPAPDTVVATFKTDKGDQKITFRELNERLGEQITELEKQKLQLRKRGVEGFVVERLVQAEAQKRGLTEEQFIKAEVEDKVPQPPEEEIKKVFEGAKSQGQVPPEVTLEQVRPQIVQMLSGQERQKVARTLFEDLKKKANVQISLPEPPRERKEVAATGPARGPEKAPITIVEFSDFECPFCSRAIETVDQVMKTYEGKVRLVFRHFPLSFHPNAQKAAEASLCAADQGKFWEMHDKLFQNQKGLGVDKLKEYATGLGLDAAKFNECLDSGKKAEVVKADMDAGQKVGVNGTPAFFINGVMLSGAQPFEEFKSVIDAELKEKPQG